MKPGNVARLREILNEMVVVVDRDLKPANIFAAAQEAQAAWNRGRSS